MSQSVTVEVTDTSINVSSLFHPAFVAAAKDLGGRWPGGFWEFDPRDEDRVRALLTDVYGTDGSPCQLVDVRLDVKRWYKVDPDGDEKTIYFAGREIAHRRYRDSSVRLGSGVVIVEGKFPSSGGSMKYPAVDPKSGTILEIRDVPAGHKHVTGASEENGVTVLAGRADPAVLRAERATLVARLAEIDAQLAEIEASTSI